MESKTVTKACARCGKPFQAESWREKHEKYKRKTCSRSCGRNVWPPIMDRFWASVKKNENGCWEWLGHKNSWGYGFIFVNPARVLVHRWSYRQFIGPIPEKMILMHSCDNPGCVRPDHLILGTLKDNSQDMIRKGRAHWQRPKQANEET